MAEAGSNSDDSKEIEKSTSHEKTNTECEEAMRKFIEITETNEACAHFFLQDFNWELKATDDITDSVTLKTTHNSDPNTPVRNFVLSVMSWNIDGIDDKNLSSRFIAICYTISNTAPDVVFLQEMTSNLVTQIKKNLGGEYSILVASPDQPYFTVVLLKPFINLVYHKVIPYPTTNMGRAMQLVEASISGHRVILLNTHLESTKNAFEARISQINTCFKELQQLDDGRTVMIFGGDLNIRDAEMPTLPSGFSDAWIEAGSNKTYKFTWDTLLNDNKFSGSARHRFDRIIFKSGGAFSNVNFSFEGQRRIRSSLCFPSDHWAILTHFY
ncbi:unnamed protein product [Thelazia callipaeda]|uniref:5'-tyrosyl-DNA phosphodiesterase n=1 Tax=Thelazia callipaeda TaxID=103827 RepID=A0A0N5D178_THECL|nr:unnamed protein product [Thelazia callipaeda]